MRIVLKSGVALVMLSLTAACTPQIQVQAPSEPIHLKIDLNIKHELAVQIENEVGAASATPAIPLAKRAGWIGERYDGYIGVVPSTDTPEDMRSLALNANEERRKRYEQMAEKHKVKVEYVEQVAGSRFIDQSKPGEFVLAGSSTAWTRKAVTN